MPIAAMINVYPKHDIENTHPLPVTFTVDKESMVLELDNGRVLCFAIEDIAHVLKIQSTFV